MTKANLTELSKGHLSSEEIIAIYGTLRTGGSRSGIMGAGCVKYLGTGIINNAVLLQVGGLPTVMSFSPREVRTFVEAEMLPPEVQGGVVCELYTMVRGSGFRTSVLDRIEGTPSFYDLAEYMVVGLRGARRNMCAYTMQPRVVALGSPRIILSGDWTDRHATADLDARVFTHMSPIWERTLTRQDAERPITENTHVRTNADFIINR
jgi:gamma-glutamylcyclotransferase (GGCT)/AIG2-like uncharacterized protein YtfP